MNARPAPMAEELSAAFAWWRDAGVDCDFADDATDWLAKPVLPEEPAKQARSPQGATAKLADKPTEKVDLFAGEPPADLPAFHEWWLSEPGLDRIGPRGRIAPRGVAGADLMVLLADPEEGDSKAVMDGTGPQARLLANMLAAMGIADDRLYCAAALPRPTPMADLTAMADAGFGEIIRHHIGLAAPKRLLVLGTGILPLLGHDTAQETASLREFNQTGSSIPLMVSEGLDSILAMPRLKARFWRRWLEWTRG